MLRCSGTGVQASRRLVRCWCMWVLGVQQSYVFCAGACALESCTCTSVLSGLLLLDLACELSKLGKVLVKPAAVPVHALLVGYGELWRCLR